MTDDLVLLDVEGYRATITINRPAALNTLTAATLDQLEVAVDSVTADAAIRVVVVTGAGDRSFVAGADINELNALPDEAAATAFAGRADRVFQKLATMPKPVIASINGFALGGGCELALACDVRLASDRARLGQPEVNYGIIAGWGGTQRLPRVVGLGMAKYLLFSGVIIDAAEALRIGLVDRVYPADQLASEVTALASLFATKGPLALAETKAAANWSLDGPLSEGLAREAAAFGRTFASDDRREGTSAFLDKRPAQFSGR